jgi:hypothetical protein
VVLVELVYKLLFQELLHIMQVAVVEVFAVLVDQVVLVDLVAVEKVMIQTELVL